MEEDRSRKARAANKKRSKYEAVGNLEGPDGEASWSMADGTTLLDAIIAVTNDGDAIMLSKSRDGGALGIMVYSQGATVVKEFLKTQDEVNELLSQLIDACK